MGVNINLYTSALVIEFGTEVQEKSKAKSRLIRKSDIKPMTEELSGRLSAQVNGVDYCIAAMDFYNSTDINQASKGGVLYINQVDGVDVDTTEELKNKLYEWLSL